MDVHVHAQLEYVLSHAESSTIQAHSLSHPGSQVDFTPTAATVQPKANAYTSSKPNAAIEGHAGDINIHSLPAGKAPIHVSSNYSGQQNGRILQNGSTWPGCPTSFPSLQGHQVGIPSSSNDQPGPHISSGIVDAQSSLLAGQGAEEMQLQQSSPCNCQLQHLESTSAGLTAFPPPSQLDLPFEASCMTDQMGSHNVSPSSSTGMQAELSAAAQAIPQLAAQAGPHWAGQAGADLAAQAELQHTAWPGPQLAVQAGPQAVTHPGLLLEAEERDQLTEQASLQLAVQLHPQLAVQAEVQLAVQATHQSAMQAELQQALAALAGPGAVPQPGPLMPGQAGPQLPLQAPQLPAAQGVAALGGVPRRRLAAQQQVRVVMLDAQVVEELVEMGRALATSGVMTAVWTAVRQSEEFDQMLHLIDAAMLPAEPPCMLRSGTPEHAAACTDPICKLRLASCMREFLARFAAREDLGDVNIPHVLADWQAVQGAKDLCAEQQQKLRDRGFQVPVQDPPAPPPPPIRKRRITAPTMPAMFERAVIERAVHVLETRAVLQQSRPLEYQHVPFAIKARRAEGVSVEVAMANFAQFLRPGLYAVPEGEMRRILSMLFSPSCQSGCILSQGDLLMASSGDGPPQGERHVLKLVHEHLEALVNQGILEAVVVHVGQQVISLGKGQLPDVHLDLGEVHPAVCVVPSDGELQLDFIGSNLANSSTVVKDGVEIRVRQGSTHVRLSLQYDADGKCHILVPFRPTTPPSVPPHHRATPPLPEIPKKPAAASARLPPWPGLYSITAAYGDSVSTSRSLLLVDPWDEEVLDITDEEGSDWQMGTDVSVQLKQLATILAKARPFVYTAPSEDVPVELLAMWSLDLLRHAYAAKLSRVMELALMVLERPDVKTKLDEMQIDCTKQDARCTNGKVSLGRNNTAHSEPSKFKKCKGATQQVAVPLQAHLQGRQQEQGDTAGVTVAQGDGEQGKLPSSASRWWGRWSSMSSATRNTWKALVSVLRDAGACAHVPEAEPDRTHKTEQALPDQPTNGEATANQPGQQDHKQVSVPHASPASPLAGPGLQQHSQQAMADMVNFEASTHQGIADLTEANTGGAIQQQDYRPDIDSDAKDAFDELDKMLQDDVVGALQKLASDGDIDAEDVVTAAAYKPLMLLLSCNNSLPQEQPAMPLALLNDEWYGRARCTDAHITPPAVHTRSSSSSSSSRGQIQQQAALALSCLIVQWPRLQDCAGLDGALVELLGSNNLHVQKAAAWALARMAAQGASCISRAVPILLPPVVELLTCSNEDLQEEAAKVVHGLVSHSGSRQALTGTTRAGVICSLRQCLSSSNGEVQQCAAELLEQLAENPDNIPAITADDGIFALLQLLRSWLQEHAVSMLWHISRVCDEGKSRASIISAGGIQLLANFISSNSSGNSSNSSREEMLNQAARTLVNLVFSDTIRKNASSGTILPLTHLLSSNDRQTQEHAAAALVRVACADLQVIDVVQLGTIGTLRHLLSSSLPEVQQQAAAALKVLAYGDSDAKQAIVAAGGVHSLARQLQNIEVKVQEEAAKALVVLLLDEDSSNKAMEARVPVVPLMQLASSNSVVQQQAVAAIRLGSFHRQSSWGVNLHVGQLYRSSSTPVDQGVLVHLLWTSGMDSSDIREAGLVDVLVQMLSSTTAVPYQTMPLLRRLASCAHDVRKEFRTEIIAAGGIQLIVRQLSSQFEWAQLQAAALLRTLALQDKGAIIAAGALQPLVQLLESSRTELQSAAAATLWELAKHAAALTAAGAIPPLLNLLSSHNTQLQAQAAGVLAVLALEESSRVAIVAAGGRQSLLQVHNSGCDAVQAQVDKALSRLGM